MADSIDATAASYQRGLERVQHLNDLGGVAATLDLGGVAATLHSMRRSDVAPPQFPTTFPQVVCHARATAFYFSKNTWFQFTMFLLIFFTGTVRFARVLKLCDVPDFLQPFRIFVSHAFTRYDTCAFHQHAADH